MFVASVPTNGPTPPRTLLPVSNDADSLIEPDVDEPSDLVADEIGSNGVVAAEPDPAQSEAGSDDAPDAEVDGDGSADVDVDATQAVPITDLADDDEDLDQTDEVDGESSDEDPGQTDEVDGEFSDDEADDFDDEYDDASPFGDELRLPDEDGYDGVDYMDDDLLDEYDDGLFEGDPEEYELDFGPAAYPAPTPQAGDVLVLDDAAAHRGPPPQRRMSRMERRRRVRLQARRVRRIIRHVEPWSVLKVSIFFYACLWVIFLVAGFMIWGVAESSGTVDRLESLILELFALDTFDFDAGQIFRGYALGGLALSIAGTTFNVLMCLLFNLISDLTGGVRITMIEEESARPIPPRRRRRRPPPRR